MTAQLVHSVMAAGLADPNLLATWRREPALLRHYGIEPDELDLDALWRFAGLSSKVRHNPLRSELPFAFRLMAVTDLELELFANYASFRAARGPVGASLRAKLDGLLEFLGEWLDMRRREHLLLWDLVRHEAAQVELSRIAADARSPVALELLPAPSASSVAHCCGSLILREFQSNPRHTVWLLRERQPNLAQAVLEPQYLGYWWNSDAAQTEILELDAAGAHLLSLIDGKRSVRQLQSSVGARGQQRRVLNALNDLAGAGLICFAAAERGTP
jgi:hypothetical protein